MKAKKKNIFQSYENLLAKILSQQDIDNKSYERMKIIMEKLIINNISPYDLTNIYFKDLYNLQDFNDKENTEKLCNMQMIICDTIENIINELNQKNEKLNNIYKKSDSKIVKFRQKFAIKEEDASDETIKEYLKKYNNNENETYRALMIRLIYK